MTDVITPFDITPDKMLEKTVKANFELAKHALYYKDITTLFMAQLAQNGKKFVPIAETSSLMSRAQQAEQECLHLRTLIEEIPRDKARLLLKINKFEQKALSVETQVIEKVITLNKYMESLKYQMMLLTKDIKTLAVRLNKVSAEK